VSDAAFELPDGWGTALLQPSGPVRDCLGGTVRSYDHLGTELVWTPGLVCAGAAAIACDLEHEGRFASPVRVPGAGPAGVAIQGWLATEVAAKLTREPILAFLVAHGVVAAPPEGPVTLELDRYGGHGTADVVIVRSVEGRRRAAFGVLRARPPV